LTKNKISYILYTVVINQQKITKNMEVMKIMFKKVLSFIICIVMLASIMSLTALADIDLGAPHEIEGDGRDMLAWYFGGDDLEPLKQATQMVVELNEEVSYATAVFFGTGNGWDWPAGENSLPGGSLFTINLAEMKGWFETIENGNDIKIYFCNWDGGLADKFIKAFLVLGDGSTAAVVTEAPADDETPAPVVNDAPPANNTGVSNPVVGDSALVMIMLVALLGAAAVTIKKVKVK